MKKFKEKSKRSSLFAWLLTVFIGLLIFSSSVSAQLLNEIVVNVDFADTGCEFVEIIGTPGSLLENIYFVPIEGDGSSAGRPDTVVDLSPSKIGGNGLLVIASFGGGNCAQVYNSPPTTLVEVDRFILENGSTTWTLISSPTVSIYNISDLDTNNDGTLDALPADAVILDSIARKDGGAGDIVYGPEL